MYIPLPNASFDLPSSSSSNQSTDESSPTCSRTTLISLSWNIEGLKRNLHSLKNIIENASSPDLIFLSETHIFCSDLMYCMSYFKGEYCSESNSEDRHNPEIAMSKSKATGGTMVMWKKYLDKYITIHPVTSASFLPVVLSMPGCPVTVHFALYLPTSGREADFLDEVTKLNTCLMDLSEKYENCLMFIRGDGNVNTNNTDRMRILASLISTHSLSRVYINHKTYHHFLGGGAFDSNIDIILQSKSSPYLETVTNIFCKYEFPDMDSHHDAILSSLPLPALSTVSSGAETSVSEHHLITAPRLNHVRHKILWTEPGIELFEQEVAPKLSEIRKKWLNPVSKTCLAILLAQTNTVLNKVALDTNESINLNKPQEIKSKKKPRVVKDSEIILRRVNQNFKRAVASNNPELLNEANDAFKVAKNSHRILVRSLNNHKDSLHNEKLFGIISSRPSSAFSAIKSAKSSNSPQVPYIKVGQKRYEGDRVVDGLFESLLNLKTFDFDQLSTSPHHDSLMEDYYNIKYLCAHKSDLPPITLTKSKEILLKIKPGVNDFYSITANHFINAGIAGFVHFNLLLNAFIIDVNNCTIEELNTVYALLLYKGHKKDRTLDTSYRTISTCPLLAKGLDVYVRDLSLEKWNNQQAETQYQGEGSSHELASLMVTEAIQHSKFTTKLPTFLLFLDARSAFDTVIIQYLIRSLFLSGMRGDSVTYFDNRLSNRKTCCEFDKTFVGPILDQGGLEQGGIPSSDLYKLYNNELLTTAQRSKLGIVMVGSMVLSAVGQADDTGLLSNDLYKLQHLLEIALQYCLKFGVQLSPSKTKLLVIQPSNNNQVDILYNPVNINGKEVNFVDQAEHVGVIRSAEGNLPNILQRLSSFKSALGSLLSSGLARGLRSNPATSLRVLAIYGTPVLMSGLASLVLSPKEVAIIDQQFKRTLQNILNLSVSSPSAVVHFKSGSLPATAILHLRQISLFGMICRLPSDPLNTLARQPLLTSSSRSQSWFIQVRNLLLVYQLEHPLKLLDYPPSKDSFKRLVKAKVTDFWEQKLRQESSYLPSLKYFHPQFMSLRSPHKLLLAAGPKMYEICKAKIQLKFLCSQYPCGERTRHWTPENSAGICTFLNCYNNKSVESPEHILLHCPAYNSARNNMIAMCLKIKNPISHGLVTSLLLSKSNSIKMQFLLDSSSISEVIASIQLYGEQVSKDLFYCGRNWCFVLHRERLRRLGQWKLC